MKYVVLDLETSIKNRGEEAVGKMKAAPWHPENKVVMSGFKTCNMDAVGVVEMPMALGSQEVLVGHNIKFDLHYLMMADESVGIDVLPRVEIWDTQLAEYILTGQRSMYAKLDDCSVKYGGTVKDDRIKDFWANDVDTEDIPKTMLREYLEDDVCNTELVFLCQYDKAKEMGMLPLMRSQMRALKATIEMEFNGMYFDREKAREIAGRIKPQLEHHKHALESDMQRSGIVDANCNSARQIGAYLFGGPHTYTEPVIQVDEDGNQKVYKSGARKGMFVTKNEKVTVHISGVLDDKPERTPSGEISVSDAVLSKYSHSSINRIKAIRKLSKDLNTYYIGYGDLVWGNSGIIHHSLNHCATGTGRLSCTSPNLQNTTTES